MRISLENYYAEQIRVDCKTSVSKALIDIYVNLDEYILKLKNTIEKFSKNLIDPITMFQEQLTNIYQDSLNDYKNSILSIYEHKKIVDKQKHKYIDSCKQVVEKESQILKMYSNCKKGEINLESLNDNILKLKSISDSNLQQYKYEILNYNSKQEEIELKYWKIMNLLKSNEESRIFFTKCHLEKFSKTFEDSMIAGFDFINVRKYFKQKLNSNISEIKVQNDIKFFNEPFAHLKERFQKEKLQRYENYVE